MLPILNRASLAALSLAALSAAAAVAIPTDYALLPPQPQQIGAQLAASKVTLAGAIQAAELDTGGLAGAATFEGDFYKVEVFGDFGGQVLTISTGTARILSREPLPWLPGTQPTTEWITTESGLRYAEIVVGDGPTPAGPTAMVECHYESWLVDGSIFDTSRGGSPVTFGLGQVIEGWREGILTMQPGGKRKLIIPASLAYGDQGAGPIPTNATLIFDIELISLP